MPDFGTAVRELASWEGVHFLFSDPSEISINLVKSRVWELQLALVLWTYMAMQTLKIDSIALRFKGTETLSSVL
eukprot:1161181-Pelagomonas_calceolata.AAC.2